MFKRILIANRGEIALRIIRSCREMGIETVAVYNEADENAQYLKLADETICIGPPSSQQSYLDIPRIISAAEIADVQAIHPGYGFLSENAHFAEICRSCRIEFIGPSSEAIQMMGNKTQARALAKELKVPMLPGSDGVVTSDDQALAIAHEIGYPVIVKAVAGGGGRGMRVAHNDMSLVNGLRAAAAEAEAAFKDGSVYVEKYIEGPRHIEIQILADHHGNLVHLGERDCSLQRRHQKVVEEAPSPALTEELRQQIGADAKRLAQGARYTNAGTVEFLLDNENNYYFMEMNTRLQVEHPVTEMVTGIDLIREQLLIAYQLPMTYTTQEQISLTGSSIECRINAEDPDKNFKPSPGLITEYYAPGGPGVRLDSHACAGYTVPSQFDSMIGKLIVHRPTRDEAILTMRRALQEYLVSGIKTTIPMQLKILNHSRFRRGEVDTAFIENYILNR